MIFMKKFNKFNKNKKCNLLNTFVKNHFFQGEIVSGTRRKKLRNSVKVQDFSFAPFEFFPSRKLEAYHKCRYCYC